MVLLNEAKMHFHVLDVEKLTNVTALRLQDVLDAPEKFTSDPEGVIAQLQGLKIVLVASCSSFSAAASEACAKAGIHQLQHDGSGFECVLGT